MPLDGRDFAATLEHGLNEGLSLLERTVREVGAQSVSVVLPENRGSMRIAYHWPGPVAAPGAVVHAGGDLLAALKALEGPAVAEGAIARFFNRTVAPSAASFLLVPWPETRLKVIVAFGYASGQPIRPGIPNETSLLLRLAALATWIASEIRRLRGDLGVVNERLGQRKMVERAKGILQSEHGWTEQQAYEHLRQLSRRRRKTLADTAQDLLRTSHQASPPS